MPDWTYDCIVKGVALALARLHTSHIDIVHLHSCDIATLQNSGVIDALDRARAEGKIRVVAYSGENEALRYAVDSGRFRSLEASINICDQKILEEVIPHAQREGLGVIAKRPVANAPWRFAERPVGDYAEEYWYRWKTMNIDPAGLDWLALALRFVAWLPGVHSCIVGTRRIEHLRRNAEIVAQGPLPDDTMLAIRQAFGIRGHDWHGQL